MNYITLLKESSASCGNCACMGLDPVASLVPSVQKQEEGCTPNPVADTKDFAESVPRFFEELFVAMKKANLIPAAFKPNIGYYTIYDRPFEGCFDGSIALARLLKLIREHFGKVPIILDAKRGDIATSSLNYASEAFDVWQADCTTVSPYMGHDSIEPFITGSYADKGIYLLNRTSNKGAKDFQNLPLSNSFQSSSPDTATEYVSSPLFLSVSQKIANYAKKGSAVGAVVGATSMDELKAIARFFAQEIAGGVALLIPGVGSQGGSAKDVISVLKECEYDTSIVRINSSSNLTHPWKKSGKIPSNYIDECLANIAELLRDCKI